MSRAKHILIRDHKAKGQFYQLCDDTKRSQEMNEADLLEWKKKNSFLWKQVSCPTCLEMREHKKKYL